jgi:nitrite reductase (NO-forming)
MSALSFIESSDFRTLAFNALPGEPDNNPTINMEVGDKVVFDVNNDGVSFHSFGVTADEEGFGGIIPGTEIATPSNPLKNGESGTSEFIAGDEGIFYYICTVPGHREQ